eukprot:scaffold11786_cov119-Isochrysis_galbana.AAC.1
MATETPPSPKRPRDPSSDNKVSQRATSFDPVWPERQIVTTGKKLRPPRNVGCWSARSNIATHQFKAPP